MVIDNLLIFNHNFLVGNFYQILHLISFVEKIGIISI